MPAVRWVWPNTSDTIGNVIGASTKGNVQIAIVGQASCALDGAITAGTMYRSRS